MEDLKVGGAEKVLADIVLGLNKEKFEKQVWCISKGGSVADYLLEKGIRLKILDISSYHNPLNIFDLKRQFKKNSPDIVHTHGYFASVIGRIAAKYAGIPVLINHVHSTYWEYKKRNIWMENFLSRWTDRIICCSKAVKDFVTDHERIEPTKTTVIYNGVIPSLFSEIKDLSIIKKNLGITADKPVIGTVSSLTPHKGLSFLLQAIPQILSIYPSAQCLFIGDGPLKNDLLEQAEAMGISSHVKFLGIQKDIPNLLAVMDVFVLPSTREGLGISIIEAMAAEKPVVATDTGGIPEVISDKKTGLLVPPKDPDALAQAIIELLNNPESSAEMGRMARKKVLEKFTQEQMISEIEDLYESLINHNRKK